MADNYILTPYFLDEQRAGLMPVATAGWSVNNPALLHGERQQRMVALYRPLRDKVTETARRGDRPISVAGDCCTSLAVLAGLQQAGFEPMLIWLEAHGDLYTCTAFTQADNVDRESVYNWELRFDPICLQS